MVGHVSEDAPVTSFFMQKDMHFGSCDSTSPSFIAFNTWPLILEGSKPSLQQNQGIIIMNTELE